MTAAVFDYPAIAKSLARIEGRELTGQSHDPYGVGEDQGAGPTAFDWAMISPGSFRLSDDTRSARVGPAQHDLIVHGGPLRAPIALKAGCGVSIMPDGDVTWHYPDPAPFPQLDG